MSASLEGAGQYGAILARFDRLTPGGRPGTWKARCPVPEHGDRNPSLSLWVSAGGDLMARCKANRGCTFNAIVEAVGTRITEWKPNAHAPRRGFTRRTQPVIDTAYDYRDEKGALLFQVIRWQVKPGEPKRFSQRRPAPAPHKGWVNGLAAGDYWRPELAVPGTHSDDWDRATSVQARNARTSGQTVLELSNCRAVLYRLPALVARENRDQPIVVVEGEKDADLLTGLGYLATTCPGGAGKWRPEYATALLGRRVVVIADNDTPGWLHACSVAGSAVWSGAASVRCLTPPGVGEKGDIGDWLNRYLPTASAAERRAAVAQLVRGAAEWTGRTDPDVVAERARHLEELRTRWGVPTKLEEAA